MPRNWSRPPRIALFTDTFDEISGVGRTFGRLCAFCRQRDWPLDLFTVTGQEDSLTRDGSVTIHRLRPRLPFNYYPGLYFDLVPIDQRVMDYARRQDFDVIHVATPGHMGMMGLYLASQLARPVIGSYHTELPQYVSQRLTVQLADQDITEDAEAVRYVQEVSSDLTWDLLAVFYNPCVKVLVPSEPTRRDVAERLRPPLHLFPRGVDTSTFTPERRQRTDDQQVRVLYVGRLAVEKNLDWLVAAATAHPELAVTIVGDGPLRGDLERALPTATFTGFLQGEALSQVYADADLFAFPSLTETFGNVVLEAQASGLPAIVGHLGGPAEIIEPQRTGLVASSREEFVQLVGELAADPTRRHQMAAAARQRALRFSWDEVFEGLYAQYRSVVFPWRRKLWLGWLQRLRQSDHPVTVGLIAFWKQFGRRRAKERAKASPLRTGDLWSGDGDAPEPT